MSIDDNSTFDSGYGGSNLSTRSNFSKSSDIKDQHSSTDASATTDSLPITGSNTSGSSIAKPEGT